MNEARIVAGVLHPQMADLAESLIEFIPAMERLIAYQAYPSDPDLTEDQQAMVNYHLCQLASMDIGYVTSRMFKGINLLLGPNADDDPDDDILMVMAEANAEFAAYNEGHLEIHPDCPGSPATEDFVRIHRAQAEVFLIMARALRDCAPHFQTMALRDLYDGTHDEETPGR
jgi:hypothetical protein